MGGKPGFSRSEMRRRRAAFGREMERGGMPSLVYGANRSGSAVSWLTGWPVAREALLVVAPRRTTMCSWCRSSITFRRPAAFR